jgi:hypothetical protein
MRVDPFTTAGNKEFNCLLWMPHRDLNVREIREG